MRITILFIKCKTLHKQNLQDKKLYISAFKEIFWGQVKSRDKQLYLDSLKILVNFKNTLESITTSLVLRLYLGDMPLVSRRDSKCGCLRNWRIERQIHSLRTPVYFHFHFQFLEPLCNSIDLGSFPHRRAISMKLDTELHL